MRKNRIILALTFLVLAVTAWAWGGSATGQITDLTVSSPMAQVKGHTDNGSLWLAYTVYWDDGHEEDYKPKKVKGKFSESLSFQARPQGLSEVVVCLWRDKVSASECAKNNGGKACEFCRKNGFHMEDRVDRTTGN